MLLNQVHLLPDDSGALICQKLRLIAMADPLTTSASRDDGSVVAALITRLSAVIRQRRPKQVVWLGNGLAQRLSDGAIPRRSHDDILKMIADVDWRWIADDLPADLPGQCHDVYKIQGLTFRHIGQPSMAIGEISAQPAVYAPFNGQKWPCYLLDGRKMLLPPFGPQAGSHNPFTPPAQSLFRRPFQALILMNGRIVTRQRSELDQGSQPPMRAAGMGPAARSGPTHRAQISPLPDPVPVLSASHPDAPAESTQARPRSGNRMQLLSYPKP